MVAWKYEISPLVLKKNIFQHSKRNQNDKRNESVNLG